MTNITWEKQLAQGGMGTVYLAKQTWTKRFVVVKLLQPYYKNSPDFIERFKLEAEILGQLKNPHIVNILDFGFAELKAPQKKVDNINPPKKMRPQNYTQPYLVMEYLEGLSLAEKLSEDGTLPLKLVLNLVEQICAALEAAHKQSIIHRDLKPDNIWLQPDGSGKYQVKLLDLGIAKFQDNSNREVTNFSINVGVTPQSLSQAVNVDADASSLQSPTTHPDAKMGTFGYMAPEQFNNLKVSAQSDIYSLGIIIYQMLSGKLPFSGSPKEIQIQLSTKECPTLDSKLYNVPEPIVKELMLTLKRNPRNRPKTALRFAQSLKARNQNEFVLVTQAFTLITKNLSLIIQVVILYSPWIFLFFIFSLLITNYIDNTSIFNTIFIIDNTIFSMFITSVLNNALSAPKVFSLYLDKAPPKLLSRSTFNNLLNLSYAYLHEGYIFIFSFFSKIFLGISLLLSIIMISCFFIYFPLLVAIFYTAFSIITTIACIILLFSSKTNYQHYYFFGYIFILEGLSAKQSRKRSRRLAKTSLSIIKKQWLPRIAVLTASTIIGLLTLLQFTIYALHNNTSGIADYVVIASIILVGGSCAVVSAFVGTIISLLRYVEYINARLSSGEIISQGYSVQ